MDNFDWDILLFFFEEYFFSMDFPIAFYGFFHSIFSSKNSFVEFHGFFRSIFFLYGFALFRRTLLCETIVQLVERWAHVREVKSSNLHEDSRFWSSILFL
jgi:hypothetical protein